MMINSSPFIGQAGFVSYIKNMAHKNDSRPQAKTVVYLYL